MQRRATISALLLVGVGVVLGTTVFRTNIAEATGLKQSQSVIVDNTAAEAVPVREQNLDGSNIKVHEQGVVTVRQAGTRVRINLFAPSHLSYVVPAGKRLVIEYVSGHVEPLGGSAEFIELGIVANGASAAISTFAAEPIPGSDSSYTVNRETRIYMSAGETVSLNPDRAEVSLYGTLDDA
jgi:hypothetical protein